MKTWETVNPSSLQWDGWLREFSGAHVFQSSGWAAYKQAAGWGCVRLICPDEMGRPCAMLQALIKPVPMLGSLLWAAGGPLWRTAPKPEESAALAAALGSLPGARYVRVFDMSTMQNHYAPPWQRPSVSNGSGATVLLDVVPARDRWLVGATAKHRYYVRRALREPLEWRVGNDAAQFAALAKLTGEMSQIKNATHQRTAADLQVQATLLGSSVITLVGYLDGQPVSGCQVLLWGTMAIYATAAANLAGREISAAYAMIAQLREVLRAESVVTLDLGGIDPLNPAAGGVDHFKLGFGGRTVSYSGEWEYAASPLYRALGNLAVRLRRGRQA